eukprot:scaffold90612_cov28-Phaeocystis_antarctica.AAC.1
MQRGVRRGCGGMRCGRRVAEVCRRGIAELEGCGGRCGGCEAGVRRGWRACRGRAEGCGGDAAGRASASAWGRRRSRHRLRPASGSGAPRRRRRP